MNAGAAASGRAGCAGGRRGHLDASPRRCPSRARSMRRRSAPATSKVAPVVLAGVIDGGSVPSMTSAHEHRLGRRRVHREAQLPRRGLRAPVTSGCDTPRSRTVGPVGLGLDGRAAPTPAPGVRVPVPAEVHARLPSPYGHRRPTAADVRRPVPARRRARVLGDSSSSCALVDDRRAGRERSPDPSAAWCRSRSSSVGSGRRRISVAAASAVSAHGVACSTAAARPSVGLRVDRSSRRCRRRCEAEQLVVSTVRSPLGWPKTSDATASRRRTPR